MARLVTLGHLALADGASRDLRPTLGGDKRLVLLVYLAVARPRVTHRRDTLLATFWPELDGERGRRALRQALYTIRRTMGSEIVSGWRDEEVGFDESRLQCDVLEFERRLDARLIPSALDLYQGNLLQGFHLPDCVEFDRCADVERHRLQRLASDAAWRHADTLSEQRAWSEAIRGRR